MELTEFEIKRNPLKQQLLGVFRQAPSLDESTQRNRSVVLLEVVQFLWEGYRLENLKNIRSKHVAAILQHGRSGDPGRSLNTGELASLRWLLGKFRKKCLLPAQDAESNLGPAAAHACIGKKVGDEWLVEVLSRTEDLKVRALMLLGRHFGMTFEEAARFRPHQRVRDFMLWIIGNGRTRYVWIVTQSQRDIVEMVQGLVGDRQGSLIDPKLPYEAWVQSVYRAFKGAGLCQRNGATFQDLRWTFAVTEFERLIARGCKFSRAAKIVSFRLGYNPMESRTFRARMYEVAPR